MAINLILFFIWGFFSIQPYAQSIGDLTIPFDCHFYRKKSCVLGGYRENMTVTLIPEGSGTSCRVLTGVKKQIETKTGQLVSITELENVESCGSLNSYRVAVMGPVDSYRSVDIEISTSRDDFLVATQAIENTEKISSEIKRIFRLERGFLDYLFIELDGDNVRGGPIYALSTGRLTEVSYPCSLLSKAVVVHSNFYYLTGSIPCESGAKDDVRYRVYLLRKGESPVQVYNNDILYK